MTKVDLNFVEGRGNNAPTWFQERIFGLRPRFQEWILC